METLNAATKINPNDIPASELSEEQQRAFAIPAEVVEELKKRVGKNSAGKTVTETLQLELKVSTLPDEYFKPDRLIEEVTTQIFRQGRFHDKFFIGIDQIELKAVRPWKARIAGDATWVLTLKVGA